MKRWLLLLLIPVLFQALPVRADLYQGEFEFESGGCTDKPNVDWTGAWSQVTSPAGTWRSYCQTTTNTNHVALTVDESVCSMAFYVIAGSGTTFQITVTDTTGTLINPTFTGATTINYYPVIINPGPSTGDMTVDIKMTNAGTLQLDSFRLLTCGIDTFPRTATPVPTVPTATVVPTATPPNTPVPTATILPSSTPGVPTATILPSSTPGVPTATILPSSTAVPTVPTATRIASSTPVPTVPTATILPSSTPGVPTATILPSSTAVPTVPTATILPSSTPANTPVDTATAVPTLDINDILTLIAMPTSTPGPTATDTPTPTETFTPSPAPWVYATVASGQLTRFDYVASASDVHIANILTLIVFSAWAMFFFGVFVLWRTRK